MIVAVAMSGGVDSSVTAALLKEEGHRVIGVTMALKSAGGQESGGNKKAIEDARRVSEKLGIPHHAIDFSDIFDRLIIEDFFREYGRGRTPNPCVRCNRFIKFGALLDRAREMGADLIATGHYAIVEKDKATGQCLLKKAHDTGKDQSYFLHALSQEQLSHCLFPIGNYTKKEVRVLAADMGLPVADRADSQEICFISGNDFTRIAGDYIPHAVTPGPILSTTGKVIGEHRGIMHYTVGQRHGLGIAAPEPLYVTAIRAEDNAIIVGNRAETYAGKFTVCGVNWTLNTPEKPVLADVKIRYRHPGTRAEIVPLADDKAMVALETPQMAIAPGQAAVFYREDVVIGGGMIEHVCRD